MRSPCQKVGWLPSNGVDDPAPCVGSCPSFAAAFLGNPSHTVRAARSSVSAFSGLIRA